MVGKVLTSYRVLRFRLVTSLGEFPLEIHVHIQCRFHVSSKGEVGMFTRKVQMVQVRRGWVVEAFVQSQVGHFPSLVHEWP